MRTTLFDAAYPRPPPKQISLYTSNSDKILRKDTPINGAFVTATTWPRWRTQTVTWHDSDKSLADNLHLISIFSKHLLRLSQWPIACWDLDSNPAGAWMSVCV